MAAPRTITSRDNPLLQRLRKLAADPAGYRKSGEAWIEGEHLCYAFAAHGGLALHAVVTETGWARPALRALAGHAAAVVVVAPALMAGVSTLASPAEIAFVVRWGGIRPIVADVASIVLDRLQDAGNVGTILRSAAAFGFAQVIALSGTAALWSPKVLRAGMGAHFALRLVEGVEPAALEALRLPLLASSPHAAQAIDEVALPWPCAWVLGHEGQGIAPTLLERCAQSLRVPQPGGEESLNAAAAAAVCLYESARQRRALSR
jgi:RNA methyltransferase, TrmH family